MEVHVSLTFKVTLLLFPGEELYAPHWHPVLTAPIRPYWARYLPSSAALSFNFAIDQYTQPREIFWDLQQQGHHDMDELDMEIDGKMDHKSMIWNNNLIGADGIC